MTILDWFNNIIELQIRISGRKQVTKKDTALRIGILGAANIGPSALIVPSDSHAEVIIAAVAARDKKRAEEYAKRWNIPIVHESYEALINDSSIDCIYNPLPCGLHYEWTIKALKAGKHVLLEKPSTSNAAEAKSLFRHPVLQAPNAPVLVEASHYRFHPAWNTLLSLYDAKDVEYAEMQSSFFAGSFPPDDIRFQYELSGGATMDLGHYAISCLRGLFQAEPVAVTSAKPTLSSKEYDPRCDMAMTATYEFPNGGVGSFVIDEQARGGYWFPWLTSNWPSFRDFPAWCSVRLREEKLGTQDGLEHVRQKTLLLNGMMISHDWHRIDITTVEMWRDASGKVVRQKKSTESKKAYTWPEGHNGPTKGDASWATYRYQLEEFVNKVKGREGSGVWIDGEDSIKQLEMSDKTYEKAGMLLRPTSKFFASLDGK